MVQPVTRLFDSHEQAAAAVRELESAGVEHSRISLVAPNGDGLHNNDNDAADGAAKGATTGGLLGGGAGLLAGLGMLAIPGVGPVVAAGWLVSTAVGAIAGAVAGGAAGGLLGALKDAGHSDEDANVYAEGVRRGGTLVSVKPANDAEAATAERILNGQRGVNAATRGAAYRQAGWSRFDETGQPYGPDEVAAERTRYSEPRSFLSGQESGAHEVGVTDPIDRPATGEPPLRSL